MIECCSRKEEIRSEARRCPHCQGWQSGRAPSAGSRRATIPIAGSILVLIPVVFVLLRHLILSGEDPAFDLCSVRVLVALVAAGALGYLARAWHEELDRIRSERDGMGE